MDHQRWMLRTSPPLVFAVLFTLACNEGGADAPTAVTQVNVRSIVTPSLAATLNSKGEFPDVAATGEGGRSVINPARARELALGYMRQFGPYMRDYIERTHGRAVDFATLTAEPRVLVAESPYEALPTLATSPYHKAFGPYYLVTLRASEGPVVNVAVSAYSTDIDFVDGKLKATGPYGNEFQTWAVWKSGDAGPRYTPEDAARIASLTFGTQLQEAPRFVRLGSEYVPQLGRWRIRFAQPAPVTLSHDKRGLSTDVVYLDRDGTFSVPAATSESARLRFRSPLTRAKTEARVAVKPGFATALLPLTAR